MTIGAGVTVVLSGVGVWSPSSGVGGVALSDSSSARWCSVNGSPSDGLVVISIVFMLSFGRLVPGKVLALTAMWILQTELNKIKLIYRECNEAENKVPPKAARQARIFALDSGISNYSPTAVSMSVSSSWRLETEWKCDQCKPSILPGETGFC